MADELAKQISEDDKGKQTKFQEFEDYVDDLEEALDGQNDQIHILESKLKESKELNEEFEEEVQQLKMHIKSMEKISRKRGMMNMIGMLDRQ